MQSSKYRNWINFCMLILSGFYMNIFLLLAFLYFITFKKSYSPLDEDQQGQFIRLYLNEQNAELLSIRPLPFIIL